MSIDIQRYTPLKRIVAFAVDEADGSSATFDKFWGFAFRALVDIYLGMSAEPISVRLPVMGNKTVNLPPDCITWTKIGVMGSGGKVSTIKVNKSLSNFKGANPDRMDYLQPVVHNSILGDLTIVPYFLNFYNNGYFAPLFGIPAGLIQFGECTVDENNRIIILAPNFPFPDIVLEYLSSPEQNEDYQVEIFLQEAIIAFIKWKAKIGSEGDYYNRLREARRKMEPIRGQEINEVIRRNNGYKIKA